MSAIKKLQGAYLPHWQAEGATYFVTFRLAGSLPAFLARDRESKRKEILARLERGKRDPTPWEIDEWEELHFEELDHRRHDRGACFLKDKRIAQIVANALTFFEGSRYRLFAWCIMSNHVHVVFQPLAGWDVPRIMHSWKRHTARKANQILGRSGTFWWPEYYDHLIGDKDDLERCVEYTWKNPDKAGLRNYKWRWRAGATRTASKAVIRQRVDDASQKVR